MKLSCKKMSVIEGAPIPAADSLAPESPPDLNDPVQLEAALSIMLGQAIEVIDLYLRESCVSTNPAEVELVSNCLTWLKMISRISTTERPSWMQLNLEFNVLIRDCPSNDYKHLINEYLQHFLQVGAWIQVFAPFLSDVDKSGDIDYPRFWKLLHKLNGWASIENIWGGKIPSDLPMPNIVGNENSALYRRYKHICAVHTRTMLKVADDIKRVIFPNLVRDHNEPRMADISEQWFLESIVTIRAFGLPPFSFEPYTDLTQDLATRPICMTGRGDDSLVKAVAIREAGGLPVAHIYTNDIETVCTTEGTFHHTAVRGLVLGSDGCFHICDFPVPVIIDHGKQVHVEAERAGSPITEGFTEDKGRGHAILMNTNIPLPVALLLRAPVPRQGSARMQEIEAREDLPKYAEVAAVLADIFNMHSQVGTHWVVKPATTDTGIGVRFFDLNVANESAIAEFAVYVSLLQNLGFDVMIQQRIYPPLFTIDGVDHDWNLRVFVTLDDNDEPVIDGIVVRYGAIGGPINLSLTAHALLLPELMDRLKLNATERTELESEIKRVALATYRRLTTEVRNLAKTDTHVTDVLGVDIIPTKIDDQWLGMVIEINAWTSGGQRNAGVAAGDLTIATRETAKLIVRRAMENKVYCDVAGEELQASYDPIDYYRECLEEDPENTVALIQLSNQAIAEEDYPLAIKYLKLLVKLSPRKSQHWYTLGYLLIFSGIPSEDYLMIQQMASRYSVAPEYHFVNLTRDIEQLNPVLVRTMFRKEIAANPNDRKLHLWNLIYEHEQKNFFWVFRCWERAFPVADRTADQYLNGVEFLMAANQPARAILLGEEAHSRYPEDKAIRSYLCQIYLSQNDMPRFHTHWPYIENELAEYNFYPSLVLALMNNNVDLATSIITIINTTTAPYGHRVFAFLCLIEQGCQEINPVLADRLIEYLYQEKRNPSDFSMIIYVLATAYNRGNCNALHFFIEPALRVIAGMDDNTCIITADLLFKQRDQAAINILQEQLRLAGKDPYLIDFVITLGLELDDDFREGEARYRHVLQSSNNMLNAYAHLGLTRLYLSANSTYLAKFASLEALKIFGDDLPDALLQHARL